MWSNRVRSQPKNIRDVSSVFENLCLVDSMTLGN